MVQNVTDMYYMVVNAESFDQDLNDWDVYSGANMERMFEGFGGNIPDWYDIPEEESEDDYEDDNESELTEEQIQINRQQQLEVQKQCEKKRKEAAERNNEPEKTLIKPSCSICCEELNNVDGPGPSTNCEIGCNDVVNACENNHLIHRGCLLESCNAENINAREQMTLPGRYMMRPITATTCPICREPLLYDCNDFEDTEIAKQVPYEKIGDDGRQIMTGGRRRTRKYNRNHKSRKYKSRKYKSRKQIKKNKRKTINQKRNKRINKKTKRKGKKNV